MKNQMPTLPLCTLTYIIIQYSSVFALFLYPQLKRIFHDRVHFDSPSWHAHRIVKLALSLKRHEKFHS